MRSTAMKKTKEQIYREALEAIAYGTMDEQEIIRTAQYVVEETERFHDSEAAPESPDGRYMS
jgi:hypothetical protein